MKKILTGLLILSSLSFANWTVVESVDEFNEKTGQLIGKSKMSKNSFIIMHKEKSENKAYFRIITNEYIGGKSFRTGTLQNWLVDIKVKVDKNQPVTLTTLLENDRRTIRPSNFSAIIEQMKKGNTLKILIEKSDGTTTLREVSLQNFTKVYNQIMK